MCKTCEGKGEVSVFVPVEIDDADRVVQLGYTLEAKDCPDCNGLSDEWFNERYRELVDGHYW